MVSGILSRGLGWLGKLNEARINKKRAEYISYIEMYSSTMLFKRPVTSYWEDPPAGWREADLATLRDYVERAQAAHVPTLMRETGLIEMGWEHLTRKGPSTKSEVFGEVTVRYEFDFSSLSIGQRREIMVAHVLTSMHFIFPGKIPTFAAIIALGRGRATTRKDPRSYGPVEMQMVNTSLANAQEGPTIARACLDMALEQARGYPMDDSTNVGVKLAHYLSNAIR